MRSIHGVVALIAIALLTTPAEALPKRQGPGVKPIQNNCSQEQLNSPIGAQCVAQGTQDILDGKSNYHFAYCSSSGAVLCCETDGFRIINGTCTQFME